MDLLLVKAFETIYDTGLLKPWHNSRPVATEALDDVGGCFAILFRTNNVLALLLEELLLLRVYALLGRVVGQAGVLLLPSPQSTGQGGSWQKKV